MFTDMKKWAKIRLDVLQGDVSKREILRREGIHWDTLKKVLTHPEPPGYQMKISRPKPKIGPYLERIAQIIDEDKYYPKKQRHTAKRVFERIQEQGYEGGYTQVKEAVRPLLAHLGDHETANAGWDESFQKSDEPATTKLAVDFIKQRAAGENRRRRALRRPRGVPLAGGRWGCSSDCR